MKVDAIVNAANSHLQHGGGVAGAISSLGGPQIQKESDAIGYVPVGQAVVTGGGKLPARYVVHAIGPRMGEGDEDEKLRSATVSSLERAEELKVESLAMPAISTGIFGYPMDRCARIMLTVIRNFEPRAQSLKRVVLCLHGQAAFDTFHKAMQEIEHGG